MIPLVVGTRDDVAGFALAGVPGMVCTTREEIAAAFAAAGDDALVILSASIAALAPERTPQLVVVLP
jgi:vacuolar-type H+-ATPase subunit F/Vma7